MNDVVIRLKDITKIYNVGGEKVVALDRVNLEIKRGEICCLLGASGSGKSTLLNVMAGIEKLTSGEVIMNEKKVSKFTENQLAIFRQKYLGFVFQSYNLINSLTALENVEMPLIFKRISAKNRRQIASVMLDKVGLTSRVKHRPTQMSGGQQQRVGIARAFVTKPEIVFADEPTGNLDSKTANEIIKLIKQMARENNQTLVIVTHDAGVATFADKIIHIHDGSITKVEEMEEQNEN